MRWPRGGRILTSPETAGRRVAGDGLPFAHDASTSTLPRARRPLKWPSGHADGNAGRKVISPAWLCKSISAIPAAAPRLASIWNDLAARVQQALGRRREQGPNVLALPGRRLPAVPTGNVPGGGPTASAGAVLHPALERHARGPGQFGRASQRDFVAGKQRKQVRDVAHPGLVLVVVLAPFLQLAVLPDLEIRDALERVLQAQRGSQRPFRGFARRRWSRGRGCR